MNTSLIPYRAQLLSFLKKVQKTYEVTYQEILDGYLGEDRILHFSLGVLPNWLFAVWLTDDGIWTFCEHRDLIDKFKKGRCLNDKPFEFLSDYLSDIDTIVNNEAKSYFMSNNRLDDDEWNEDLLPIAKKSLRMWETSARRKTIIKEKKLSRFKSKLQEDLLAIPGVKYCKITITEHSMIVDQGEISIHLLMDKDSPWREDLGESIYQDYSVRMYDHHTLVLSTTLMISSPDYEDYSRDIINFEKSS